MTLFNNSYIVNNYPSGNYVNGEWVNGTPVEFTIYGTVQPVLGDELEALNIGQAGVGKVKVYTNSDLIIATDGGVRGSIIFYRDQKFEVIQKMVYDNGLINHFKYIAELRLKL